MANKLGYVTGANGGYKVSTVEIYAPNQPPVRLTTKDTISGGTVLPNFQLAVKDIFK